MITLYTGVPGSGKSYHVAGDIIKYYRKGKNVFCNFEVNEEYLKQKYGKRGGKVFSIDNRDLKYPFGLTGFSNNFHTFKNGRCLEGQSLLVIDECQNNFDTRKWNEAGRTDWNHWFSEHRKDGFEVVLITQADTDIDKKIRGRVEYLVKHFKLNNFKIIGKALGIIFGGNIFIQKFSWYTKGRTKSETIATKFLIGIEKQYRIFNTSKHFLYVKDEDKSVWKKR